MKAIKKMEITKVLSCFLVFVILMSLAPVFVTQSDAVMLIENYMGKVVGKDIKNNELTVQIEYKADYSTEQVSWVPYHTTSQWAASMDAINEIQIGDYIEICDLSACIGKMRSSEEKIITDVYGDPDYLISVLLGDYIIAYENTPDCSKYHGIGISGCNVEAKYSDVTIRKENRQLKSQRLYPSQNYGYEDEEYKVDITFNSGEAPAYPDCTDQPCFGPQAFSDFTIHIKKKAEGKPDLIIDNIYWSPANPKVGDSVVITAVAKNIGSASSERCEGVIRVFDEHMPSLYFYIPELAPNEKYEESMNWKAEECGEYSVEARADYDKEIDESNEWNNRLEEMINIPCKKRPDLTVEEVRWEPENPSIGDSITFTIKVKNQGDGDAGECEAWSAIEVGSDISICDFAFTVSSLTPGEEFTYIKSCKATECGEFYVAATVGFWDAVEESNDNNYIEKPISISCIEKKPDLIIQDISWNPSNPDKGDTVTFYVDIKNQGSGSAGISYVYYYIDGTYVTSDSVPGLSAGSTSTQTFTWTANKCGDVQVKAVADATNAVDESNEGNNEKTKTVSVACPNHSPTAYIDSITPNPANQGETVSFSGHGTDPDGDSITAYNWRSSIEGQLSTSPSFSTSSLSVRTHTVYFKVKDSHNAWSSEVTKTLVVNEQYNWDEIKNATEAQKEIYSQYKNFFDYRWWNDRADETVSELKNEVDNLVNPIEMSLSAIISIMTPYGLLVGDVDAAKLSISTCKILAGAVGGIKQVYMSGYLFSYSLSDFDSLLYICDKEIEFATQKNASLMNDALKEEKNAIKDAYIQLRTFDAGSYDRARSMKIGIGNTTYIQLKNQIAAFRHSLEARYSYITYLLEGTPKNLNEEIRMENSALIDVDFGTGVNPLGFGKIKDIYGALASSKDSDVFNVYLEKDSKIGISLTSGYSDEAVKNAPDFKFYVSYNSKPTEYSYGWKGENHGEIEIPSSGTYWFMVCSSGHGEYRLEIDAYPSLWPTIFIGKRLDKELLVFSCPVHVTITDKSGRVITDTGINEIPNANIIVKGEEKIFYLPLDCTYSTEIDAYDTGTFDFTRVSPIGTDISITKFENIPVTSNTKAFVEIEPGVTDYTMSIDYDGDGVTDEEKSPDVNETIVNVGPENDYAKDSYIKVVSGTIAGQDINPNNPEITVSSAKKISGSFDISVRNTGHSGSIFPIVANPNWGPHESSYWSITGHQAPGIKTHTVNVDLNAPSKPGVYYIIVAGQWELSAANVASGTNWVVGENHWNDGNDLADWSTSMIGQAIKSGLVIADWEKVEGMVKMYVPATAIRVKVTEEPEKDVIEIPIRSGKDDGYFMTFVSDSINDTSDILIGQVAADIFSLKFSTFMRFPNVAIPKDAKITKAYITVVPTFTNQSGPLMKITATDQSNPTIPKDYSDYSNRLRTKASVDWDASNWNEGVSVNSPDISSVIQELVDSYDYLTGAPILFFLDDADTEMRTKYQLFAAYEHTEHEPAKLHIEYITGGESESPLKITITSDKEEYSPGDSVTITTRIKNEGEEPVIITNPIITTFVASDGSIVLKEDLSYSISATLRKGDQCSFRPSFKLPDDAPEGYYDVTASFSGGKYVKTAENLFFVKAESQIPSGGGIGISIKPKDVETTPGSTITYDITVYNYYSNTESFYISVDPGGCDYDWFGWHTKSISIPGRGQGQVPLSVTPTEVGNFKFEVKANVESNPSIYASQEGNINVVDTPTR